MFFDIERLDQQCDKLGPIGKSFHWYTHIDGMDGVVWT
jgi:hypothetical protein